MNEGKKSLGEAMMNPATIKKVAPDVVSSRGQSKLQTILQKATAQKDKLDTTLKLVAKGGGADFSSRVKNPETIVQKIALKRLQGRDYKMEDTNDVYGGRIIVDDKKQIPSMVSAVRQALQGDGHKVLKDELVKTGTYQAHHIDFQTKDGTKGETQVMIPQQALEAVANHSLRALAGEKPPEDVKKLRDAQASIVKKTPNEEAKKKVEAIQTISKANQDKPTHPVINASILAA